MVRILVKKFNKSIKLPTYKTSKSSGMDLAAYIKNKINISPGKTRIIPTGIAIAIPKNYEIQIRPRSGLAAKNGISVLNTPGTIDADYRGELMVLLTWIGEGDSYTIPKGERIAQLVISQIPKVSFFEVSESDLGNTTRGEGGFGSTGRF